MSLCVCYKCVWKKKATRVRTVGTKRCLLSFTNSKHTNTLIYFALYIYQMMKVYMNEFVENDDCISSSVLILFSHLVQKPEDGRFRRWFLRRSLLVSGLLPLLKWKDGVKKKSREIGVFWLVEKKIATELKTLKTLPWRESFSFEQVYLREN